MTAQLRRGSEPTRCASGHNVTYRGLRLTDEHLLSLRNHLLSTPFQQRFDSPHRTCPPYQPEAGTTATSAEVADEVTD
jgi:hypothetical protein